MSYSSPAYFFFFMFVLLLFWAVSEKWHVTLLFVASLAWTAFWRWEWAIFYLCFLSLNYLALRWASSVRSGNNKNRVYLSLVFFDVAVLLILKSNALLTHALPFPWKYFLHFEVPYGLSFCTFIVLGYIFDSWRGFIAEGPSSLPEFCVFCLFFPLMMGGPIERYAHLGQRLKTMGPLRMANVVDGGLVFFFGLAKKVIVGGAIAQIIAGVFPPAGIFSLVIWGLLSTLHVYVDFSAFCDMGRGAALCFGLPLGVNFRAPYLSKNPIDFWRRWNISLAFWVRDYFTLPLLLRWGRKIPNSLIVLTAFLIIGLWHNIELHWLLFGVFNGVAVLIYSRWPRAALGYLLAFLVFWGNGVLQDPKFSAILTAGFRGGPTLNSHWHSSGIYPALTIWVLFIVYDLAQEYTGNLDFYLKMPARARQALCMAAVVIFFGCLAWQAGNPSLDREELPVYFRF